MPEVVVNSMPDPSTTKHPEHHWTPMAHPPGSLQGSFVHLFGRVVDQLILGCTAVAHVHSFILQFCSMLVEGWLQFHSHLFFIPGLRQGKQLGRSIHCHGKEQKRSQALKPLLVRGPSPPRFSLAKASPTARPGVRDGERHPLVGRSREGSGKAQSTRGQRPLGPCTPLT